MAVFFWRRHPDLNWGIKVLQTSALPLGYGALLLFYSDKEKIIPFPYIRIKKWSGIRGSNPLPQPWQGCALPDELIPRNI